MIDWMVKDVLEWLGADPTSELEEYNGQLNEVEAMLANVGDF